MSTQAAALPTIGGPLDGDRRRCRGAFLVAEDGSIYQYHSEQGGAWMYCGPLAGRCDGCGAIVLPADEPEKACRLCGGRVARPGRKL